MLEGHDSTILVDPDAGTVTVVVANLDSVTITDCIMTDTITSGGSVTVLELVTVWVWTIEGGSVTVLGLITV